MPKPVIGVMAFFILISFNAGIAEAQKLSQVSYPCSVVLHSVKPIANAQGVALITKLSQRYTPGHPNMREREGISIYADWLPSPSSFGDYNQYEGFAQVEGLISWRFRMYPVKDVKGWFDGTAWVGKSEEVSLGLPINTKLQVRLSNSQTNKLGPVVLQNTLEKCPAQ